jgi:hypothetical protein
MPSYCLCVPMNRMYTILYGCRPVSEPLRPQRMTGPTDRFPMKGSEYYVVHPPADAAEFPALSTMARNHCPRWMEYAQA